MTIVMCFMSCRVTHFSLFIPGIIYLRIGGITKQKKKGGVRRIDTSRPWRNTLLLSERGDRDCKSKLRFFSSSLSLVLSRLSCCNIICSLFLSLVWFSTTPRKESKSAGEGREEDSTVSMIGGPWLWYHCRNPPLNCHCSFSWKLALMALTCKNLRWRGTQRDEEEHNERKKEKKWEEKLRIKLKEGKKSYLEFIRSLRKNL